MYDEVLNADDLNIVTKPFYENLIFTLLTKMIFAIRLYFKTPTQSITHLFCEFAIDTKLCPFNLA